MVDVLKARCPVPPTHRWEGQVSRCPGRALPRSKSLPSSEFLVRLSGVKRHDSVQSAESATSAASGGGRDSGLGSSDTDPASPDGRLHGTDNHSKKADVGGAGSALGASATIRVHYYPEGGWGWVVCACAFLVQMVTHGLHTAYGQFYLEVLQHFGREKSLQTGCLGALSMSMTLLLSPILVAFCRRKSVRLTAIMGGLVLALGCLFTSFATQFHQLFISFGVMVGVGVAMCTVTANLMVGQYFKRKREMIEVIVESSSGIGILIVSVLYKNSISSMGWRFGLQTLTGVLFSTFFLGTFYRSASLYHPQRRAILHLKNQKRKIKDKTKEAKPPFFDLTTLHSRTIQILLVSTAISSFGIHSPLIYLIPEAYDGGMEATSLLFLQSFLGLAVVLGTSAFGMIVVKNSKECRIARHYLCQASGFALCISLLALTAVSDYYGYVIFVWIYGISWGGYFYSLKMFTFEKVRARNFPRTWSFVQCAQAIPIAIGIPITGCINKSFGKRKGYYFCSACAFVGSVVLFLVDAHRRRVTRHQNSPSSTGRGGRRQTFEVENAASKGRRSSLPEMDDDEEVAHSVVGLRRLGVFGDAKRPELTCISEEGLADLPDNILEDFGEFYALGDCMTSCDQVEHYLMLSEYENNLNKTNEIYSNDKYKRKKSVVKIPAVTEEAPLESPLRVATLQGVNLRPCTARGRLPTRRSSRPMWVIDEITTSL